jgi:hypothetical protein
MRVELTLNHSNRVPAFLIYGVCCIVTGVVKRSKCSMKYVTFSLTSIKVTKSRTIRWASHVAQVERIIHVHRILLGSAVDQEESG